MKPSTTALGLVLFALAAAGCKKSNAAEHLPPARGATAPALPAMPQLDAREAATTSGVLTVTGSTYAIREATLGPKASGTLAKVYVGEGDRVKKGQVLFVLDGSGAHLMVQQAEAALASANVVLARAQMDHDRTKQLFDRAAIAPAMYDQAKLGLDQAKAGVKQAEVGVATARKMAGDNVVTSPIAGVVTAKLKNAGEMVTMMPPTPVLVVQDLSTIEVRARLPESALTRVRTGDPMRVRFPSLDQTREIIVGRVNPSIHPMMRTGEVIGTLPNEAGELKSGMLVEVTFPNTLPKPETPSTGSAQGSSPQTAETASVEGPQAP